VMVKESEEQAELEQLQKELAERDRREAELAAQTKK
jgi:TRAP-type transport system small permease protein